MPHGPPLDAGEKRFPANAVVCLSDGQVVKRQMRKKRANDRDRVRCQAALRAKAGKQRELIICVVSETPVSRSILRVRLRRLFVAAILYMVGAAALAFGLDWAIFRIRVAANWNAYGSVTVDHYYAVAQKNGKTNFIFDPPGPQVCVNAVLPHAGDFPCWYLRRNPEQVTNI